MWTERGGPPVIAPEELRGFGSRLLRMTMMQLGGTAIHNWSADGAVIKLMIDAHKLAI